MTVDFLFGCLVIWSAIFLWRLSDIRDDLRDIKKLLAPRKDRTPEPVKPTNETITPKPNP